MEDEQWSSFWQSIGKAVELQQAAKEEGLCLVWHDETKNIYIRPMSQRNNPIIVVDETTDRVFEHVGRKMKQPMPALKLEDLLPMLHKEGSFINIPDPHDVNRKPNKYTEAG